jgi:hypothetical protein
LDIRLVCLLLLFPLLPGIFKLANPLLCELQPLRQVL